METIIEVKFSQDGVKWEDTPVSHTLYFDRERDFDILSEDYNWTCLVDVCVRALLRNTTSVQARWSLEDSPQGHYVD